MASLQLCLDCAGVSLQSLRWLDSITVLFNSPGFRAEDDIDSIALLSNLRQARARWYCAGL